MSNAPIRWERDTAEDGGLVSTCGTFAVRRDPVYGTFSLVRTDDPCESLAESVDLGALTTEAVRIRAQEAARAA